MKVNVGQDLYLKGRIGWKGLAKSEYLEKSGYRIINGYSLKDGYIDWKIAGYISQERYEESPEIKLEINDILISKDGTIGKVGIVRNIVEDWLDTEYLFQFLKSSNFKNFINRVKAEGSTINHLYQRDLVRLEIDIPDIIEQKRISKVLKNIDDKIEVNNKINAELEAMAKTIYDYWFVQFDFPDANGKPYKSSGGNMVHNEELKREIPEDWEKGVLDDIAKIVRGVSYNKHDIKTPNDDGVTPVLRATNITGNIIDLENMVYVPDEFVSEKQLMNKYDVLITMSSGSKNHIGKNGLFYFKTKVAFGAFCAKLEAKEDFQFYLSSYMQSAFVSETIKKECLGTSINNLNGSLVKGFRLVKPNEQVLKSFNKKMKPIHDKIGNNHKENQKLAALRDWLLPMLMNGQVTVGEAKGELGMVGEDNTKYGDV